MARGVSFLNETTMSPSGGARDFLGSSAGDWTNSEIAELYRVEGALARSGVDIEVDRGLSDEGDPWFAFCRAEGAVLVHITRFDGLYRLYSPALREPLVGRNFTELAKLFVSNMALSANPPDRRFAVHPGALLSLVIAAIFFAYDEVQAQSAPGSEPVKVVESAFSGLLSGEQYVDSFDNRNLLQERGAPAAAAAEAMSQRMVVAVQVTAIAVLSAYCQEASAAQLDLKDISSDAKADGALLLPAAQRFADAFAASNPIGDSQVVGEAAEGEALVSILDLVVSPPEGSADVEGMSIIREAAAANSNSITGQAAGQAPGQSVGYADFVVGTMSRQAIDGGSAQGDHSQIDLDQTAAAIGISAADATSVPATVVTLLHSEAVFVVVDRADAVHLIVNGEGTLNIAGLADDVAHKFEFAANASAQLSIAFAEKDALQPNSAPEVLGTLAPSEVSVADVSLLLGGGASVGLTVEAAPTPVRLVLDSQGDSRNEVWLIETSALDIRVLGTQDITLKQTADGASKSHINALSLSGQLTYAVDLGATSHENFGVAIDASNFVAHRDSSIALLNVHSDAELSFGVDLQRVVIAPGDGPTLATKLSIELGGQGHPVQIGMLSANGVGSLSFASERTDGGNNTIGVLEASDLSSLKLSGAGDLAIGRIVGIGPQHKAGIVIDASELTGDLSLDLSGISLPVGGRESVNVVGGLGDDTFVLGPAQDGIVVAGGAGANTFRLDPTGTVYEFADLKQGDRVVIGNGDSVASFHSAMVLGEGAQNSIDAQSDLASAGLAAELLTGSGQGAQAVMFVYHGARYVFVDRAGDQVFNEGTDAVVKLTGITDADLSSVFVTG